ncbi:hypothetical protein BHE74_00030524 [Ensete ventricosum]|nr:hypothetical protein GW17_00005752 [Ensete ventricosum]RWW62376.1 hypothetical protein BHE74_00030524 [Ensete ventricosum]
MIPQPLTVVVVPPILAISINSNHRSHRCCSSSPSPPLSLSLAPTISFPSLPPSLFPDQQITLLGDLSDAAPNRTTTASSSLLALTATTIAIFLIHRPPLLSMPSPFHSPATIIVVAFPFPLSTTASSLVSRCTSPADLLRRSTLPSADHSNNLLTACTPLPTASTSNNLSLPQAPASSATTP